MTRCKAVLAAAALAWASGAAHAADLPTKKAPEAPALSVADTFDPFQIRIRGVGVVPDGKGHVDQMPGHDVTVGNSIIPEIDFTYYFTRNIAIEVPCCASKNSVYLSGFGGKVADTWMIPPTVLLQWHFTNFGPFQPYIGFGPNYTYYFNYHTYNALAGTKLSIENSWGVAGQVGVDYMIDRHWGVNFDVKRILMSPNFTIQTSPFTRLTGRAAVNPWLIGAGITYRFGGP